MDPLPSTSEHIITRLPPQISLLLLRWILKTNGIKDLANLLKAFPELSKYVILLTDHPDDPYILFPVKTVTAVDILSLRAHPLQVLRSRLADVIVISSLLNCEESSNVYTRNVLKTSWSSGQGRAAMESSFVLAQLFDKFSPGMCALLRAIRSPYEFCYSKQIPKGWIHFEQSSEYARCEEGNMIGHKRQHYISTFQSLHPRKLLSLLPSFIHPHPTPIHTLSVSTDSRSFIHYQRLSDVTTVKINTMSACGKRKQHALDVCHGIALRFRTPRVNSLSISYIGCLPPCFSWGKRGIAHKNDPVNAAFVLVNLQWNSHFPFRIRSCRNILDTVGPTHTDLSRESRMSFIRRFHTVILTGGPSNVLGIMNLNEVRTFVWDRWIDLSRRPQGLDIQQTVVFPNLQKLTLSSVVRDQGSSRMAPQLLFEAPQLQDISLIALPHSNEPWRLRSMFTDQHRFRQTGGLKLLLAGQLLGVSLPPSSSQLYIDAHNLSYLASDLKNLMIADYVPMFLIEPDGVAFTNLERLSIDVSGLELSLIRSKRSVSLSMLDELFPKLEALALTLSFTLDLEFTTLIQCVVLDLPRTVRELSVTRFLACELEELVVNGMDVLGDVESEPLSSPSTMKEDAWKGAVWKRENHTEPFVLQEALRDMECRIYCRTERNHD